MQAPQGTGANIGVGLGLVAAGAAAGAGLGAFAVRSDGDSLVKTVYPIETGVLGALAVGFAGLVAAAASPKWRRLGEATAIMGVGAPLILAVVGAVKSAAASSSNGQLPQAQPGTQNIALIPGQMSVSGAGVVTINLPAGGRWNGPGIGIESGGFSNITSPTSGSSPAQVTYNGNGGAIVASWVDGQGQQQATTIVFN